MAQEKCPMCGSNLILEEELGEKRCENTTSDGDCEYACYTLEKERELFGANCFGELDEETSI